MAFISSLHILPCPDVYVIENSPITAISKGNFLTLYQQLMLAFSALQDGTCGRGHALGRDIIIVKQP